MELVLLVGSMIGGDVERLGNDDFATREAATERLAWWGLVSYPALVETLGKTEDAEVRYRINRLLGRKLRTVHALKAAAVIANGYRPTDPESYWDYETRKAAWRIVVKLNVRTHFAYGSPKEYDADAPWRIDPDNRSCRDRVNGYESGELPSEAVQSQAAALWVGKILRDGEPEWPKPQRVGEFGIPLPMRKP